MASFHPHINSGRRLSRMPYQGSWGLDKYFFFTKMLTTRRGIHARSKHSSIDVLILDICRYNCEDFCMCVHTSAQTRSDKRVRRERARTHTYTHTHTHTHTDKRVRRERAHTHTHTHTFPYLSKNAHVLGVGTCAFDD